VGRVDRVSEANAVGVGVDQISEIRWTDIRKCSRLLLITAGEEMEIAPA